MKRYKKYLFDNVPVPRSTANRWRSKQCRKDASVCGECESGSQPHHSPEQRDKCTSSDSTESDGDDLHGSQQPQHAIFSPSPYGIADQDSTPGQNNLAPGPGQSANMETSSHKQHEDNPACNQFGIDSDQDGHHMARCLYDESDVSDEELADSLHGQATLSELDVSNLQCADVSLSSNVHQSHSQSLELAAHSASSSIAPVDLMLLLLKLKHNLTKEATVDIAHLLNVASGQNVASVSMHSIQKHFVNPRDMVQVHHVCKYCGSYIGIVSSETVTCKFSKCQCSLPVAESLKCGHFFFYLPLRQQLIDLLENHNVSHLLFRPNSCNNTAGSGLSDIQFGNMYKSLQFAVSGACYFLTLTFNCDGVPVFKSSNFSIWPVLCVVNELPPDVRGSHILMAALWFGVGKPDMNVFLEPFVEECKVLAEDGFAWFNHETHKSNSCIVTVLVGVCDAIARPLMQNMKQFNGHYGCGYCFADGESVEKGIGRTTVYPFNDSMTLRSSDNTAALAAEALEKTQPCMGVKGPSLLQLLPQFDIIRGMVPDYMHCICLGVARQMAMLWFDGKNSLEPFYIGKCTKIVDSRLLCIKPPCSISRTPRSISQMKFWKAHEWLAWLLYYSLPTLKDILPSSYYCHWALLVDCVAILLGVDISLSQIVHCEDGFVQFVADFDRLYGKEHMSFNVHQTLHIVQSVKDWGPLWAHSAFMFESFNCVLLKMIAGTQGVPIQILQTFCYTRAIPVNIRTALPLCTEAEKAFIESLTLHKRITKSALKLHSNCGVTVLGKPKYRYLCRSHFVALHSVSETVSRQKIVAYYDRAVIRGEMVHSLKYCQKLKRNSYTVKLDDGAVYQIVTFIVCDVGCGPNCYAIGRYLCPARYNISTAVLKVRHINPVLKTPSALVAVPASDIVRKCVFVSVGLQSVNFVCEQVHSHDCCS